MTIIFNCAPFEEYITKKYPFEHIDVLIVNETEAAGLLASLNFVYTKGKEKEMLEALSSKFSNMTHLVMTCGSRGAALFHAPTKTFIHAPSLALDRVVDTTGAGDTFTGFFVHEFIKGTDLKASLTIANVAAALACLNVGTFDAMPTYQQVMDRCHQEHLL